ncbi:MAG: PIG-L family deacetylase [Candidatus Hydrogenedentes bacterium]|nr:PIG-L family deacetylase [Candidatus Hydrogenedentota bacterium]
MKNYILSTGFMFSLFALICPAPRAEQTELGEIALRQAVLDLSTDLRLMCVAAHPDDEDGATLAMYRKKYGYHTIAVIATRGEGGQNEIGPELYNELGVIRTREMMRAAAITGADLHFLDLPEFGFSKSPEETFAVWGHEETVRRLARVIRETRPDVIISNHGRNKDHGHHQAIGIALQEAFDAAGDPAQFSELAEEGLAPWQPQRLYLRSWDPTPDSVSIDFNELDSARGKTYAEIAAAALDEHDSQGMQFFIDRYLSGAIQAHYVLTKENLHAEVAGEAIEASRGVLFAGLAERNALDSQRERRNRVSVLQYELQLDVHPADTRVVPGQIVSIAASFTDFGTPEAQSVRFRIEPRPWFDMAPPDDSVIRMEGQKTVSATLSVPIPAQANINVPLADHLFDPHFMVSQFDVVAESTAGTDVLELRIPVALEVARPVEVDFAGAPYLVRRGVDKDCTFNVLLTNHTPGPHSGSVVFSMSPGFILDQQRAEFAFEAEGDQKIIPVRATIGENLEPRDYILNVMVEGAREPHFGVARIVDVQIPDGLNVGVIQSYDDTFMNTLERLGIPHEDLSIEDFSPNRLDAFTSIIVDIRAYLVRPDLVANNQALLDYANRGGSILVMYQKTQEWKPEYAPYPIQVSRNRVTVEAAPVTLLAPEHPLFRTPNAIVDEDWSGWIQERGLYFPDQWEETYTPLVSCIDPGEEIPPGSLLYAPVGEGDYLYCALGLYRQIRELHPGALRLFANMLALGTPEPAAE